MREKILELALDEPDLSPREVAVAFTDREILETICISARPIDIRLLKKAMSGHNIAEGFDAGYDKEFARFLRIARRSATEVQSQIYLTLDRGILVKRIPNNLR